MDVLVLNTNFESVALIDTFKSLIWTDRYNSYGDFELYVPVDVNFLGYLQKDYYLWLKESEHCMIIESISIESDSEEGDQLVVTGRSLESILDRRVVWGLKEINGNLQDGVKTLLEEAIISPTDADRKIDNFIFEASTDTKVTELTIDTQYMGEDLYSVVKSLCETNNIGFKIVLNDSNQFVFSLYSGADRSYNQTANPYVVFSPNFDNIINSNYYTSTANYKNVSFVAGEGEGSSQVTMSVGSASGLNRRELFTDASSTSSDSSEATLSRAEYLELIKTKGTEDLAEHKEDTAFECEVDATQMFKYGEDFFVGDIVQVADAYGNEGSAYISELIISHSDEGFTICPTFTKVTDKEGKSE